jgi:RNA polymerase sigma-70 factor (ECF subfamily)
MEQGPTDAKTVFTILVHEHADMLGAFLRTLMGRDPSVEDIFQQTMLVAWRRLGDYDPTRPFAPWLRGIAQVLVAEHARKRRVRPLATDPALLSEIDRRFSVLEKGTGDSFLENTDRLFECLAKLSDAMRAAIDLVYARSLSLQKAAEVLGDTKEAVTKRVQRARLQLAECMGIGEHSL